MHRCFPVGRARFLSSAVIQRPVKEAHARDLRHIRESVAGRCCSPNRGCLAWMGTIESSFPEKVFKFFTSSFFQNIPEGADLLL